MDSGKHMSLREMVGQLFIVRPESLEPAISYRSDAELPPWRLQAVSDGMRSRAAEFPVGGILLYGHNIADPSQLSAFIRDLKTLPGSPWLCVDEEGGRVSRIARNPAFDVPRFESAAALAASGDAQTVHDAAFAIGSYLRCFGFDVDFAPVADVNTNPRNIIIGDRAFSDDPHVAAPLVAACVRGLADAGILGCLKHFPGHGDTLADTHLGYAFTRKRRAEIDACELVPFRAGIAAGAPLVMTAHIAAPAVSGSDTPASLSPELTRWLREGLGFDGLIITDALEMGAVTQQFGSGEAAVRALEAGADLLLCPLNLAEAFGAVLDAVQTGRIPRERLEASVRRILALKHPARQAGKTRI